MQIDKAIEILISWKQTGEGDCGDLDAAENLAIEALKRLKEGREMGYDYFEHWLPGETK